jgi:hypothetical protein
MVPLSVASAGGAALKSGTSKALFGLTGFQALGGSLVGFLAAFLGYRMSMAEARSDEERQGIKRFYTLLTALSIVPLAAVFLAVGVRPWAMSHAGLFAGIMIGVVTSWIPAVTWLLFRSRRVLLSQHKARAMGPSALTTSAASTHRDNAQSFPTPAFEYLTKASLWGLPLIHIRFDGSLPNRRPAVKAWIAGGDTAIGVLFAFGGMAMALVCLGGFALGALAFGGFGAGLLCYAGFGAGLWAVGGLVSG